MKNPGRVHGDVLDVRWKEENHCVFKVGMTVEIEGEEKPALYAEWINYFIKDDLL